MSLQSKFFEETGKKLQKRFVRSLLNKNGHFKFNPPVGGLNFFENLILVQDERWRRALGMQVERPTLFG